MTPAAERRQAVGRLLDYYLHTADQADRVLHPFRHRIAGAGHPAARGEPGAGHAGRRGRAGWRPEWRNILQAAQYAGRHEWKRQVRRPHPRAGRLRGDQGVLGRGDRGPHPGPAGLPRPRRPGPDRAGVAGAQRGEPADRPPRGGAGRWPRRPPRSTGRWPTGAARPRPWTRSAWPTSARPVPARPSPTSTRPRLLYERRRGPARRGRRAEPLRDRLLAAGALPGRHGPPARRRCRSTGRSGTGAARRRPSTTWAGCTCTAATTGTRSTTTRSPWRSSAR